MDHLRRIGLALLVAACQANTSSTPSPPGSGRVDIPTGSAEAPGITCAGAAYPGSMTLTGDASASPSVWLNWAGTHVPVRFPLGYYATFDPSLSIHDPSGAVAVTDGADANRNPQGWPGLYICVYGNPPIVHVYRLADVLPQPTGM